MSLASRRRMMLHRTTEETPMNETVLVTNYEPNGEKFSFISEWNIDGDSLYIEWIDKKVNVLGNFISIAGTNTPNDTSCISSWRPYRQLHCYDNTNGNQYNQDKKMMLCFLPDAAYNQRLYIMLNNGVNKLLINSNGLYINGTNVERGGNNIFKALSQMPYIVVGSMEGTNRSFDHYNKISIIHEKYTRSQMAELTV